MRPLARTFADIDKKIAIAKRSKNRELIEPTHGPVGIDFCAAGLLYQMVSLISGA